MSLDHELLLLDTNIVVHLIRGNEIAQSVDEQFGLRERRERPMISVVTIGEGLTLARRFGWGKRKQTLLEELFAELVIVDIHHEQILRTYSEIAHFARGQGRALSDNDLWIAATASATSARLVTTDKDFDALEAKFLTRTWIDPAL